MCTGWAVGICSACWIQLFETLKEQLSYVFAL